MKILSFIVIITGVLSNKACVNQTVELEKITYVSRTRGGSKFIEVNGNTILFRLNGIENSAKIMADEWGDIVNIVTKIDLDKIEHYTSKKEDRARDAAWHSTIKVTVLGKQYESQTFDNANAPSELFMIMQFFEKLDEKYNEKETSIF